MTKHERLQDFDSEPVYYCSKCYSLKIKYKPSIDMEYCGDCGCSDIVSSSLEEWESKYISRYGHKFTEKSHNPKSSLFFRLPLSEIKTLVCKDPQWETIISSLYSNFPGGLSKEDSLILLFDKLSKDNRMDELRHLLYKRSRQ